MTVKRRRFAILATVLVAVNVFFWLAASGFALPGGGFLQQMLGGRLIRAEIVWQAPDGTVEDTLIYHGVITAVSPTSITLREKDRSADVIPLAPGATVRFGGQTATVSSLHRGLRVLIARPGGGVAAATMVQVEGFGG